MKDKVFIIWSGDCNIAYKIKRILEDNHNYLCYVGGNTKNDSQMFSVGDTVIRQMKSCNQAIVIFQNKDNGMVSNNLFFELGYVISKYGVKKVHCVKRLGDSIELPSDFDNSFVEGLKADSDDEYVNGIVDYFLKRQKLSIDTNKMFLINNRYIIHELLQTHYSDAGSKCSDYELAQYVLFYMQAAVMFQDDDKVLAELAEFKRSHNNEFSDELSQAINISISLLEVQGSLKTDDETVYIEEDVFRKYFYSCKDIPDEIKDDDSGVFDEWSKAIVSENLSYVCSLYAMNPSITENVQTYLFKKTIDYVKSSLYYFDCLDKISANCESNDTIGIISVFRSYVYRQMFTATKNIGVEDGDSEDAEYWLKLSLKERKSLLRNFDKNSIDSKLYKNFEMEYYLNLVEFLDYCGREKVIEFDYLMYISDIDSFISKFKEENDIHAYILKISNQRKKLI